MPNQQDRCPKCGSSDRIPNVPLVSQGPDGVGPVVAEVERYPRAFLLKGQIASRLKATVCARCGFVELYAMDAAELLSAYRTSQSSSQGR